MQKILGIYKVMTDYGFNVACRETVDKIIKKNDEKLRADRMSDTPGKDRAK